MSKTRTEHRRIVCSLFLGKTANRCSAEHLLTALRPPGSTATEERADCCNRTEESHHEYGPAPLLHRASQGEKGQGHRLGHNPSRLAELAGSAVRFVFRPRWEQAYTRISKFSIVSGGTLAAPVSSDASGAGKSVPLVCVIGWPVSRADDMRKVA